jgi:3-deoxy-manno-octulosonate cytidylyltransferase (CMP-KDO synthetase)
MKISIVIPARYGSTRFPGKPLAMIGGKTMLACVVDVAREAATGSPDIEILVTTEDQRIADHAAQIGAECEITPADCPTGSDRVLAALKQRKVKPDFVINLQGDTPFTPPGIIKNMIAAIKTDTQVITPVHQLSWNDLDLLREAKKTTPFSGTTCTRDENGNALWFSKNIIPALRKEDRSQPQSPVFQHIGIYGYRFDVLEKFVSLPQSSYEIIEGLEQLRLLENGISITTVKVTAPEGMLQSGIDTPDDLARAETLLAKAS